MSPRITSRWITSRWITSRWITSRWITSRWITSQRIGPPRIPASTRTRAAIVGTTAVVAALAVAVTLTLSHGATRGAGRSATPARPLAAHLIAASCGGPAGAAYVSDTGWDGFSAINTANCSIIQTYNVGDPQVPGDPGDYDYASTNEGIAIHGATLYFADAGNSGIAVIDAATLNPKNYNPAETDIHTGLFPEDLAVTPDGKQVWVANTGPQTSPSSPTSVSVIDTAKKKVVATLPVKGSPSQVAFSPDGTRAYVVTADGLWAFSTATRKVTSVIGGLGGPRSVVVSPDGKWLYVTDTNGDAVKVIRTATGQVTATIGVGELPWQIVLSANGKTAYVANPDSNSVSVISTATNKVTATISVPGDPDTVALTPDGSQLWVGQLTLAYVTLIRTSDDSVVGSLNLGGTYGPQSADGYAPTGIVLTKTPTPGS
jgi:YVTN family beta-propeller protein